MALAPGATPAAAAGGAYTWVGSATVPNWSEGANWAGGAAPSGTVSSLSFPASSCPSACYGLDDESLTTGSVAFDSSDIVEGSDPLTVGSGGLSATTPSGAGTATVGLDVPLTLGANQTWTISGAAVGAAAPVSGSAALGIDVSGGGSFSVIPGGSGSNPVNSEVGPITVTGVVGSDTGVQAGQNGGVALEATSGSDQAELDATDANTIDVVDAVFGGAGTSGPVSMSGGDLAAGVPDSPAGILQVDGGVTLDASSAVTAAVVGSGDVAGADYGQVDATGPVALHGAMVQVEVAGSCPTLTVGTTYTLVSTSGSITGTFSSPTGTPVPDGGTVPLTAAAGSNCVVPADALQIAYHTTASPATVTATVVAASTTPAPPGAPTSTTSLTASAGTVTPGSTVTYTATVAPVPAGGTVAFDLGTTALGGCSAVAVGSAGQASCTTSYSAVGTEVVRAVFSGDSAEAGSTSSAVVVTVANAPTKVPPGTTTLRPAPVGPVPQAAYAEATKDGWVFAFGSARYFGSLPTIGVRVDDIVGLAPTVNATGYWLVGADGGVYAFGGAPYLGSVPGAGVHVDDVVGMVADPGGHGYWLVGAHGGVYAFGGAPYLGSLPGIHVRVDDVSAVAP